MEGTNTKLLQDIRLVVRDELKGIQCDVKGLQGDVKGLQGGFKGLEDRFDRLEFDVKQLKVESKDNYKLIQRANVLHEKNTSDLQQIAEGVVNARIMTKKVEDHDERILDLEWRSEMHEKALKKVTNG